MLLHILAFCCFATAAILAGITRSWPLALLAAGLALTAAQPALRP